MLITKAYEKQAEDRAFQMYLQKYAWMDEESYMPFEEFYKPELEEENKRSVSEILDEVKEVLSANRGRWAQ